MTGDFMILNKFSEIWKSISWVLTGEKFSPRIFTDFYLKYVISATIQVEYMGRGRKDDGGAELYSPGSVKEYLYGEEYI